MLCGPKLYSPVMSESDTVITTGLFSGLQIYIAEFVQETAWMRVRKTAQIKRQLFIELAFLFYITAKKLFAFCGSNCIVKQTDISPEVYVHVCNIFIT